MSGMGIGGLALGVAGAAIGAPFGMASIGWLAGSMLGNALDPVKLPGVQGPRLNDLSVQNASFGTMVPVVEGANGMSGTLIWADRKKEHAHYQTQGGKGGPTQTTITYTYTCSFAILLCEGIATGISRCWANGKLIYDAHSTSSVANIVASLAVVNTGFFNKGTVSLVPVTGNQSFSAYLGSATQLPDPTMESVLGIGNVPAYRGKCYVVFTDFDLTPYSNAIPNFKFEVVKDGVVASVADSAYLAAFTPVVSGGFTWTNNIHAITATTDGMYVAQIDIGNIFLIPWGGGTPNLIQNIPYQTFATTHCENVVDYLDASSLFGDIKQISCDVVGWCGMLQRKEITFCSFPPQVKTYAAAYQYVPVFYDHNGAVAIYDSHWGLLSNVDVPCRMAKTGGAWFYGYFAYTTTTNRVFCSWGQDGTTLREIPQLANVTPLIWFTTTYLFVVWVTDATHVTIQRYPLGSNLIYDSHTVSPISVPAGASEYWQAISDTTLIVAMGGSSLFWYYDLASGLFTDSSYPQVNGSMVTTPQGWDDWRVFLAGPALSLWHSWGPNGGSQFGYWKSGIQSTGANLSTAITNICARAGVSNIDVSTVTEIVDGFAVATQGTGKAALDPLLKAFYYDTQDSDGLLKFKRRGGAAVAIIPYDDLCATDNEQNRPEPFELLRGNEIELPRTLAVSYPNATFDYQVATEVERRINTVSLNDTSIQLPVVMTSQKAGQVVKTLMYDSWASRSQRTFYLTRKYIYLDPADPVLVEYPAGSFNRVRIISISDNGSFLTLTGVEEGTPILSAATVTLDAPITSPYNQPTAPAGVSAAGQSFVIAPSATFTQILDIPILRDKDDTPGPYISVTGDANWSGCTIYQSLDDKNFSSDPSYPTNSKGAQGVCTSPLGNWIGGNVFDYGNSVIVNMSFGTLSSTTRDNMLNSGANAALIGSEIIQFMTATQISAGVYELSTLLRGCRGTELAMTGHIPGEQFTLLDMTLVKIYSSSYGGNPLYVKSVSPGRDLTSTFSKSVGYSCAAVKPFSVVDIRAKYGVTGDIGITYNYRTRYLNRELQDYVDVPLGSNGELNSFVADIYSDNTFTTVKRTLAGDMTGMVYLAADQITDFGSVQSTIHLIVYQLSSHTGRGFPSFNTTV